jgi:DNA-binding IclR family transcriptional regulator
MRPRSARRCSRRCRTRTPGTIKTLSALLAELEQIRACGYARDIEESRAGVFCIGVPVFGQAGEALFAFSVTTVPQHGATREEQLARAVQAAASLATTSFGGNDTAWRVPQGADGDRPDYPSRIAVAR